MRTRTRGVRRWPDFSRIGIPARFTHSAPSRRSIAFITRCLELGLLCGIVLAFAAGMMRIR